VVTVKGPACRPLRKGDLSPAQRRLLELMQHIGFGHIERLAVRGGEPVFDPPPRVVRKVKIGGENGPRPEAVSTDFCLKREVLELFEHLAELVNGTVQRLEVKAGVPFSLEVEEEPAAA